MWIVLWLGCHTGAWKPQVSAEPAAAALADATCGPFDAAEWKAPVELLAGAAVDETVVPGPTTVLSTAFVATPEGTIARVTVAITEGMVDEPARCQPLAWALLNSLRPGEARLDLDAGERTLGPLTIDLPERHALFEERGADFHVYRIYPLGSSLPVPELGIYVGNNPSFVKRGEPMDAVLLGNAAPWWTFAEGGGWHRHAIVPLHDAERVHLFISSPTRDGLEPLTSIAATLRRSRLEGHR